MERRVVLAAALSIAVLLAWGWLFPPPRPLPAAPEDPALGAASDPGRVPDPVAPPPEAAPPPAPALAVEAAAVEEIRVETGRFLVVLTNQGGRILSWKLLDYSDRAREPLELLPQVDHALAATLAVELDDASLAERINGARFSVERSRSGPVETVEFTWSDGQGLEALKRLAFHRDSYLVDLGLEVRDRGRELPARLVLGPGFGVQEVTEAQGTYYYAGQAVWNEGGRVTRVKQRKLVGEPRAFQARLRWVGFEDQYFTMLALPGADRVDVGWDGIDVAAAPAGAVTQPAAEPLLLPRLAVSFAAAGRLFVGPKKYTLLHDLGDELDKVVWFATNPFLAWIARLIFLALLWIHDHTLPNYGLAIVLATVVLRVLLFPVNQYSMVSMKKTQLQMQRLQPKIKRIRERYQKKKDAESRQKMNQETMDLYRSEGVNPMGGLSGCLPLLAQFPILIGFYNMLTVAIELRGAPFVGWIHDLSVADPYWVTPILMGATMFVQQKMAMSKVKDPTQLQQQRIMMIMPVVFTYVCLQMPSGMVLYWFVNNLLGMGQQWLVNRHTERLEAAAQKA